MHLACAVDLPPVTERWLVRQRAEYRKLTQATLAKPDLPLCMPPALEHLKRLYADAGKELEKYALSRPAARPAGALRDGDLSPEADSPEHMMFGGYLKLLKDVIPQLAGSQSLAVSSLLFCAGDALPQISQFGFQPFSSLQRRATSYQVPKNTCLSNVCRPCTGMEVCRPTRLTL